MLRIMSIKQWICAVLGIILGFIVAGATPPEGLDVNAMHALGILCWAICWWVGHVVDEYVTGILMCMLFVVFAHVSTETAFGLFSSSTWWLLLAAFALGLGIAQSGLLNRVALQAVNRLPRNFRGQVIGISILNFLIAPFIPSLSAKASMIAPLALSISDAMGYERKGREANGLFLAMLTSLRTAAPIFISGSILGYALLGFYPESVQAQFTMAHWFFCTLPWGIVVFILNTFLLLHKFKPKNSEHVDGELLRHKLQELGPMRRKEKVMLVIMLFTVLMWATEPLHGVPAHIVALFSMCLALTFRIYDRTSFRAGVNWDSLIFIGCAVGIGNVFSSLGIDTWMVSMFAPFVTHFANNPYLLIIALTLITVLLRFVIVSELAYISIFMVFLVPMAAQLNVSPWVVGFVIYAVVNPWVVPYQSPVYLAAASATHNDMAEESVACRYCIVYLLVCMIALLASVPFWQYLGLIY